MVARVDRWSPHTSPEVSRPEAEEADTRDVEDKKGWGGGNCGKQG